MIFFYRVLLLTKVTINAATLHTFHFLDDTNRGQYAMETTSSILHLYWTLITKDTRKMPWVNYHRDQPCSFCFQFFLFRTMQTSQTVPSHSFHLSIFSLHIFLVSPYRTSLFLLSFSVQMFLRSFFGSIFPIAADDTSAAAPVHKEIKLKEDNPKRLPYPKLPSKWICGTCLLVRSLHGLIIAKGYPIRVEIWLKSYICKSSFRYPSLSWLRCPDTYKVVSTDLPEPPTLCSYHIIYSWS